MVLKVNLRIYLTCFLLLLKVCACAYTCPEHIPREVWVVVEPKFLPENHKIKRKLDKIFSKPNVTSDAYSLIRAGFRIRPTSDETSCVVAKHNQLRGYILKLYVDWQPVTQEWKRFLSRIYGAELIAKEIEGKGYHKLMKVPKKWLYPIPTKTNPPVGSTFLLVAEEMHLVSRGRNKQMWKKEISKAHLDALYDILETLGLNDSIFIDNIPFTKGGRIAFVDTEHYNSWPVPYHRLLPKLSSKMQTYWKYLTGS